MQQIVDFCLQSDNSDQLIRGKRISNIFAKHFRSVSWQLITPLDIDIADRKRPIFPRPLNKNLPPLESSDRKAKTKSSLKNS